MNYLRLSAIAVLWACVSNAAQQEWVKKSNEHAKVLLETMAKFSPESAGSTGVDGLDEQVSRIGTKVREESRAAELKALAEEKEKGESEAA